MPSGEKWSGESSWISFGYYVKVGSGHETKYALANIRKLMIDSWGWGRDSRMMLLCVCPATNSQVTHSHVFHVYLWSVMNHILYHVIHIEDNFHFAHMHVQTNAAYGQIWTSAVGGVLPCIPFTVPLWCVYYISVTDKLPACITFLFVDLVNCIADQWVKAHRAPTVEPFDSVTFTNTSNVLTSYSLLAFKLEPAQFVVHVGCMYVGRYSL